jgi:flagellar hook-associated protein 2
MTSNITFTGLASGLNTTALVQNILRFDQQRITTLQSTVTTDQNQQTALQGLQTDLQTLQSAAGQLGASQGSVFDSVTATSSDSSVLTAAAGTGAQAGVTSVQVLSLAQASQVASQGYSDPSTSITQGTFQISAGSNSSTITINSTNNTLSGLASAINAAGIGVTATIVNTGSGSTATQPYRLLLTSSATGTANAIKITNNLAASSGSSVQPNFSTSVIGPAVTTSGFSGTSTVTSAGTYTGSANDQYTFTIANGGTVGTDNGITVNYTNSAGTETGTLTINASDVNSPITVADGVQVQFGTGTLTKGDQFTVNTFTPTVQAAANAQVQIGSGSGAITVQNSTNTLTNLIPGVTLSLQSAAPGQTVQINVANDVSSIAKAITNFVDDYNTFASDFTTDTKYTAGSGTAAGTAGPLNSYTSLIGIQNQVEQQLLSVTANLPAAMNNLSSLGITVDSSGQLSVNQTQLNSALTGGVSGATFNDVKNLFTLQGQSSSSGIQFSTGGTNTQPSGTNPYTVHITQAATEGSISASNSLANSTVIDSTNNTFSLNIDGQNTGTITLTSGTYTQQQLASEIQSEINSTVSSKGSSVTVTVSNNGLAISSNRYGSASSVGSLTGSAASTLGFTGSETSAGQDVQGSYVVNGVTETAKGTGQILTGNSTNAHTAGLVVVVSLTPAQVSSGGSDSTLTVTQGIASALNSKLQSLLDPVNGQLTGIANQITQNITNAQTDITNQTTAMDAEQTNLMSQFAALESVLASLQETSNLLTTELANSNSSGSSSSSSSASSAASTLANGSVSSTSSS